MLGKKNFRKKIEERNIVLFFVRYGDIYPITPIGRIIACLCSLFGAAMIGMLVSVLVDRYQRVYARKLYKKEEIIDFDNNSDDDHDDRDETDSKDHHRGNIEDPDRRARINSAFDSDPSEDLHQTDRFSSNPNTSISRQNSRVHFIIGYVDDQTHSTSSDLIETISSIVADKQTIEDNIRLSIVSTDDHVQQTQDVQFAVTISDDDEELTEIGSGRGKKGNVLKTFQSPPSPVDEV